MRTLEGRSGAQVRAAGSVWPRRVRPTAIVEALPVAAAVFSVVGFLVAAYFRVTFAYPMWVMETPTMQAIRRISQGAPLYAPPSLDYVAPIYAPLYFFVSALLAKATGLDLTAPRLVSVAASLGSAALVGYLVWSETRRALISLLAAGLFVSATALSSLSLDLARVDPLCVCFLLAAIAIARAASRNVSRGIWLQLGSGALTGLAILTKQTAVAMVVPLALIPVLDRRPWHILAYLGGVLSVVGIGAAWLYLAYGNWAAFFLLLLPRRHTLTVAQLGVFWTQKLLPGATIPLLLAPVFFISRGLRGDASAVRFWALVAAGMLGMGWVATLNQWSDENVLLPAFAVLAVLTGLGFHELLGWIGTGSRPAQAFRVYAFILLAAEFAIVGYNPRQSAPLRSDVWGADRLVSTVADLPGTVFAPDFPEYAYQAGKGDDALGLSVLELTGGYGGKPLPEGSQWIAAYRAALDQRQYDALLFDPDSVEAFLTDEAVSSGYVDSGPLFKPNDVFWSWESRYAPKVHVWLPKERTKT
jgi:4-amino-4-deoxy-L-arabinose transferase-like glycosyltransferase